MTDEPEITIGGVSASRPRADRMSVLIWGQPGVGKTTLASTLPGRKALINFDPDGPASIPDADDVTVFDLAQASNTLLMSQVKDVDNPLKITDAFDHFDTFIFDSLTSLEERTLAHGIKETKGATVERPSPGAYQARNNLLIGMVRNVLGATAKAKKHVAFICHEGPAERNDEGVLLGITLALGGKNPSNVALKLNECWNLFEQTGDKRNKKMILARQARNRKPLKSRMFDTMDEYEFEWIWNTRDRLDPTNMWVRDWFEKWEQNQFKKIQFPEPIEVKKGK